MTQIFITGAGLNCQLAASVRELAIKGIEQFKELIPDEQLYLEKNIIFNSLKYIKREDRSLLNNCSKLAIDAAIEAFSMAEKDIPFSNEEKLEYPIFMASETIENNFSAVARFSKKFIESDGSGWSNLGKIKELLHPIDMLRLLTTNPLYHVSKVLRLNGGGYPIKKMSLSSIAAIEESQLWKSRYKHALIVAVGDLKVAENICAFKKMSLLRNNNNNGIIPSYAGAAITIDYGVSNRKKYAEVMTVLSQYTPENRINCNHWNNLYSLLPKVDQEKLTIITYNNGVKELSCEEQKAITENYPKAKIFNYKKHFGYTGKANNLLDLITALTDKRIENGQYVLINGVGMSVGLGCILIKKLAHIENLENDNRI